MKNIIKIVILMTCVISAYSASDLAIKSCVIFKEDSIFTNILSRARNLEDLNIIIKELYNTGNKSVRINILKNGLKIISQFLKNRFGEGFAEEIFLKLKDPNASWENSSEKIEITEEQRIAEKEVIECYLEIWEALKFYIKWSNLDILEKILVYYDIDMHMTLRELNNLQKEKYNIKDIIGIVMNPTHYNNKTYMGYAKRLCFLLNIGFVNFKENHSYTPLSSAVLSNNKDMVSFLLKEGADTNAQLVNDSNALMWAVEFNRIEIIELLLKYNANPNLRDFDGRTPLHIACDYAREGNFLNLAKLLIDAGSDLNVQNELGNTPLIEASRNGRVEIVKLLIEAGANLDIKNNDGYTALMCASDGYLDVVELLTKADANLIFK